VRYERRRHLAPRKYWHHKIPPPQMADFRLKNFPKTRIATNDICAIRLIIQINLQPIKKTLLCRLLTISIISLFGFACNHSRSEETKAPPTANAQAISRDENLHTGTSYSDSTVDEIIDDMMERVHPSPIDTFKALHGFELHKFKLAGIKKITLDTITKYATVGNPVIKAQAELLGITDYFANLTYSDRFKLFLFYNKSMESHYGNSIDLIVIDNNSNNIEKLTLCQEYLSEGYEWKTECRILKNHQFEITKTEYFNTSNLDKNDDKVSVSKVRYGISNKGNILKIK